MSRSQPVRTIANSARARSQPSLAAQYLIIFIVQNRQDVAFDFLWFSFTWPLWLYTIVTAVFGALVWLGLGVMRRHRRRKERREERRD